LLIGLIPGQARNDEIHGIFSLETSLSLPF
jgi:hypothetical protein